MQLFVSVLVTIFLSAISQLALASCGSASCSLVTHIDGLGLSSHDDWQFDLRYEYIRQDQLRSGTHKVDAEYVDGEHTEKYTENRNTIATLDYSGGNHWGVSVRIPYVQRKHYHVFDDAGVLEDETWKYGALGDVSIVGRYMLATDRTNSAQAGFQLGLKLATGSTTQDNVEGEAAERSLQPGSGTTDVILGYFTSHDLDWFSLTERGFVAVQAQGALNSYKEFRSGNKIRANAGVVFSPVARLSPIVQINLLAKGRDHGADAEPDESGGEYLWLSPGVSHMIGHSARVYGFIQIPVYVRVNGEQLTSDWNLSVGVNW